MNIDARKPNESRGKRLTDFDHLAGRYTDGLGPEYLTGAHLYFVRSEDGSCKIGKTTDLVGRMRTLQNASSSRLCLEMYLPGMGWQEKVWHAAFCNWRKSGEWFEWNEPLRDAVEAARAGDEWIATLPALGFPTPSPRQWCDLIADQEEIALDRYLDAYWKANGEPTDPDDPDVVEPQSPLESTALARSKGETGSYGINGLRGRGQGSGIIVDNFAGGGGASTGIEAALGRAVDIAINHDEQAIRMHEANHPGTLHIRNNIWQVDPRDVVKGRHVQLAWFSPDCKHFSKAKGGKPREKSIRDLAWVVVLWAERVAPDVILLENVEEFRTWGPLDDEGQPIKARAGETFEKWCKALRKAGYKIQFRELRACDYGAPTIRKRFFMVARRDGKPIVWPEPTHGKPGSPEVLSGKRLPWRTAAEIIDWSIPCPSIFERKKPLAEKTLRRIAHGVMKFVINNPKPFIVTTDFKNTRASRVFDIEDPLRTQTAQNATAIVVPHVTKFRNGATGHAVDEPLATVTANSFIKRPGGSAPLGVVETIVAPFFARTAHGEVDSKGKRRGKGQHPVTEGFPTIATSQDSALVAATLIHRGNGEREGQAPRAMDVEKPLGTVVAGGTKHAAIAALLSPFYGEKVDGRVRSANAADEPLRTQTADNRFGVVCAHLEQANGGPRNDNLAGRAADAPLSTVATAGSQQRLVTSNLIKLRGTSDSHLRSSASAVDEPLDTISSGGEKGGIHAAEVRAFLIKYYGNEVDGHGLDSPIGTVTVQDRFGLVTVTIEGEEYVIVDIGMRMLSPRELFNAQGFPADYIIDRDACGEPITKTAQVAKCGNSVCPPIAEALVRAQFVAEIAAGEAVAA